MPTIRAPVLEERASHVGSRRRRILHRPPRQRRRGRRGAQALVEPTHREEGCILYALHQGVDDPRRLAFVERWASRELLDSHLASAHVQEVLTRVEELFGDSGEIVVYAPLPEGETGNGSLAAHAAD